MRADEQAQRGQAAEAAVETTATVRVVQREKRGHVHVHIPPFYGRFVLFQRDEYSSIRLWKQASGITKSEDEPLNDDQKQTLCSPHTLKRLNVPPQGVKSP